MKKLFILASLILFSGFGRGQDTVYFKMLADSLSSPFMAGRGYSNEGDLKAASFIRTQFQSMGLQPLWPEYFQEFSFPINTITGPLELNVDGISYAPGTEFTISSFSRGMEGSYKLTFLTKRAVRSIKTLKHFFDRNKNIEALVIDLSLVEDKDLKSLLQSFAYFNIKNVKLTVFITTKTPGWHVSRAGIVQDYASVNLKAVLPPNSKTLSIKFANEFKAAYLTNNVGAYIPGSVYPDSFIFITAHYDHLGMMGDSVHYPGYNDNSSGTAMALDLARHLSLEDNSPAMSVGFILFSGEETGLKGSIHASENPPVPIQKVNSLINLDMVGTGSEGITVVNGTIYPKVFHALDSLNKACQCLPDLTPREQSPNSDHHPFHEKGVSAVFIYTRGKEYREYHTVDDCGPLPLHGYHGLFRLLTDYIKTR